jgi:hypothetical protein
MDKRLFFCQLRKQDGSSSEMTDKRNLKQAYLSFKEENPEMLLGFLKSAELWS